MVGSKTVPYMRVDLLKRNPVIKGRLVDGTFVRVVFEEPIDISELVDLTEEEGIEVKQDTFSVRVANHLLRDPETSKRFWSSIKNYDTFKVAEAFAQEDHVKIYVWYGNPIPDSWDDALLMDGVIQNAGYDMDEGGAFYAINGANRTEILLKTVIPGTFREDTPKQNHADEIFLAIIARANELNKNKQIVASLMQFGSADPVTGIKPFISGSGYVQPYKSTAFVDGDYRLGLKSGHPDSVSMGSYSVTSHSFTDGSSSSTSKSGLFAQVTVLLSKETTFTLTYTNQDSVVGKTATVKIPNTALVGDRFEFTLDSGDTGVFDSTDCSDNQVGGTGSILILAANDFFPITSLLTNYKSTYELCDELSGVEHTEDFASGKYIVFVDNDFRIHWNSRNVTTAPTFTFDEKDLTSVSFDIDTKDLVNGIIMNVGNDPELNGILAWSYDLASMGKNGSRWKYVVDIKVSQRLMDFEQRNETPIGDVRNVGKKIDGDTRKPVTDAGGVVSSWIMTFELVDFNGNGLGTDTILEDMESIDSAYVNNNLAENYVRAIRYKSRALGKEKAQRLLDIWKDGILSAEHELELGTNEFVEGDLFFVESESRGWEIGVDGTDRRKKMRLKEITHNFNLGGWNTTHNLSEDEKVIAEGTSDG